MSQHTDHPSSDLLSIAGQLSRHARLLAWGALVVLVVGRGLLQLLPDRYTADASFAPSGPSLSDLGSLGALGGMAASLGLAPGGQQGPKFYADLAQSDPVLLRALDTLKHGVGAGVPTFDYPAVKHLKAKSPLKLRDAALAQLRGQLTVTLDVRTAVVTVEVADADPALAYALTRAIIAALDRFNVELLQNTARARTRFLEERVVEARAERAAAEGALRSFLVGNRQYQTSPALALRAEQLQQEFEAKNTNLRSVLDALDKSRVEQSRDTPVLMMLGEPLMPATPSGPHRTLLALELAFLWVFGASMIVAARAVMRHVAGARPVEVQQIREDLARVAQLPSPRRARDRDPVA